MEAELTEVLLLDENLECSYLQLLQLSGLTEDELFALMDCGVLTPINEDTKTFSGKSLVTARAASRLRDELELDPHALAVILRLLDRIGELEAQLRQISVQRTRKSRT